MQSAAKSTLVRTDSPFFTLSAKLENSISRGRLLQEFSAGLIGALHKRQELDHSRRRIIAISDFAYASRQFDAVCELGSLLAAAAADEHQHWVGRYYQALGLNRGGHGAGTERARLLFEDIAEKGSARYRAKALLALGSGSFRVGEQRVALSLYEDSNRNMSRPEDFDPVTAYVTRRMRATMKGINGDHFGAVADLKALQPLVLWARLIQPQSYYDYLNTLAVETAEAGWLQEALHYSETAASGPYGRFYHEWHETRDEITFRMRRASRSIVAVSQPPAEVASFQATPFSPPGPVEISVDALITKSSAPVINLQDWKKKAVMKPQTEKKKLAAQQVKFMSLAEKQATIARLVYDDNVTEDLLDSILAIATQADADEDKNSAE